MPCQLEGRRTWSELTSRLVNIRSRRHPRRNIPSGRSSLNVPHQTLHILIRTREDWLVRVGTVHEDSEAPQMIRRSICPLHIQGRTSNQSDKCLTCCLRKVAARASSCSMLSFFNKSTFSRCTRSSFDPDASLNRRFPMNRSDLRSRENVRSTFQRTRRQFLFLNDLLLDRVFCFTNPPALYWWYGFISRKTVLLIASHAFFNPFRLNYFHTKIQGCFVFVPTECIENEMSGTEISSVATLLAVVQPSELLYACRSHQNILPHHWQQSFSHYSTHLIWSRDMLLYLLLSQGLWKSSHRHV